MERRLVIIKYFADKIIGNRYGRLNVVGSINNKCVCNCDCGTKNYITKPFCLENSRVKSCGCIAKEKKNRYEFQDDYVIGFTNKDEKFYFDIIDFELISKYTWRISSHGYLQTTITKRPSKKVIEMHSYLLGDHIGFTIDHINRNKNDNRRSNLRLVSYSVNGFNIDIQINNSSGKTGVSYNKKNNNYMAYLGLNNKRIYLGSFITSKMQLKREKMLN